jgi:hypothetical protein
VVAKAIAHYIGNAGFLCCIYDIHAGLLAGAIIIVACSLLQTGLTVPERLVNVS